MYTQFQHHQFILSLPIISFSDALRNRTYQVKIIFVINLIQSSRLCVSIISVYVSYWSIPSGLPICFIVGKQFSQFATPDALNTLNCILIFVQEYYIFFGLIVIKPDNYLLLLLLPMKIIMPAHICSTKKPVYLPIWRSVLNLQLKMMYFKL